MRALYFTAPGTVEVREETLPDPAPGEVRVQTAVTAISPGTEMLVYRGQLPAGIAADETIPALAGTLAYPLKYGYCAVGRVAACGPEADPALLDRPVFSFQPHQTEFNARIEDLVFLPPDLAFDDAVCLPNVETALSFIMDGAPLAGERVAVVGQGIVGLLTTALLSRFPLERLASIERLASRRSASQAAGAAPSLSPDEITPDFLHSFDLVYELSGAPEALNTAIDLAGAEGRIVVGSWYGEKAAALALGGHFHRGRLRIISSQVSTLAPGLRGRWTKPRRLAFALELARRLQPARFITHRFPLERAADAYRLVDTRPDLTIQVVFDHV